MKLERPKRKFINPSNFSPNPDIINDCEVRRQGYNHCYNEMEAWLPNEDELKILVKDTTNKERLRNTGDKGHPYSEFCSCGSCHSASIIAKVIHERIRER